MITLKELREMGYNKEVINEISEKYGKIIPECEEASDNLENNNDFFIGFDARARA